MSSDKAEDRNLLDPARFRIGLCRASMDGS